MVFKEEEKKEQKGTEAKKMKNRVITGNILVSRNPCTHPGDLRILKAVDKSE